MNKYADLLRKLESQLEPMDSTFQNTFEGLEKSISMISEVIQKMRMLVRKEGFSSEEEEIHFFKEIKPKVFALLAFHIQVLDIETKGSFSTSAEIDSFLNEKLRELQTVLKDNTQFIRYYKSGATHMDKIYFTRNTPYKQVIIVNNCSITDPEFSTSYCQVVAHVLTFNMVSAHVERKRNIDMRLPSPSSLRWTENKVALVELIYALQTSGAISDGTADAKEICRQFETIFNINAGDIYRTFLSIKLRKTDRTRFLDKLSHNLIQRMEASEM